MREWCGSGSGSGSGRIVGSAIQPLNYACSKTISRTRTCIVSFERFFCIIAFSHPHPSILLPVFFFLGFVSFDEGCLSICKFCLMGGGT
jgi:hypothetical protein